MRGGDRPSGTLIDYVDVEADREPSGAIDAAEEASLAELDAEVFVALRRDRAPSPRRSPVGRATCCNCSHAIDAGIAATGRTDGVRHAVSLVRRVDDRREGLRRLDLLEEPRPPAHRRDPARVSVFAARPAGGEGASERRAFFGRRNDAESLGVDEELPSQERLGRRPGERPRRAAASAAQPRGRLSQDQAIERDARLDTCRRTKASS